MKISHLTTIVFTFFIFQTNSGYSQQESKSNIIVGASIPNLPHVGFSYEYHPNLQASVITGFFPDRNENLFTLSFNQAYYFGKVNSKIDKKLWSFNGGLTWLAESSNQRKSTRTYLNLYFAKELVLSNRLILQPQLGYSIFLWDKVKMNKTFCCNCYDLFGIPFAGIDLVWRL